MTTWTQTYKESFVYQNMQRHKYLYKYMNKQEKYKFDLVTASLKKIWQHFLPARYRQN